MMSLVLALTAMASFCQGDLLDGDPNVPSVRYENADIHQVLRALFGHIHANFSIESDIHGNVNLELKNTPFSVVLKKTLDQVQSSCSYEAGVYRVEKTRDHPSSYEILKTRLPAYDFRDITVKEALDLVFEDSKVAYRFPKIEPNRITLKLSPGTLQQDLDILLPLTKCKVNFTHGRFEMLPLSEEKPPKALLDRNVLSESQVRTRLAPSFARSELNMFLVQILKTVLRCTLTT